MLGSLAQKCRMPMVFLVIALATGGTSKCGGVVEQPGPCDLTFDLLQHLRVDSVRHPSPVLAGTELRIRGESFISDQSCVLARVDLIGGVGGSGTRSVPLEAEVLTANDIVATVPPNAIWELGGPGQFTGVLRVRFTEVDGGGAYDAQIPVSLELAEALTPSITRVGQSSAFLNDPVTIEGAGFIDGGEGTTEVVISGTYTVAFDDPDHPGRVSEVFNVRVPATLVTVDDRSLATFAWTPRIGGIRPGAFTGQVTVVNTSAYGGSTLTGPTLPLEMTQEATVLFGIDPAEVSLGQITDVTGRGFIGSPLEVPDPAEGTTSLRLVGDFYPCTAPTPMDPIRCTSTESHPVDTEVVGEWVAGDLVRYTVTVSNDGGRLHAVDFSRPEEDYLVPGGRFEGTIIPILTLGVEQIEGIPLEDAIVVLGPIRQICWVRFLHGFSDSLDLFGLGAVEAELRERIITRMQEIYRPPDRRENWINVEFRSEEPQDFYPGGYAILEIGGPDPNNMGLFGYDNTPGKDAGNLRLWDHVGGRNALGELDGYGYGGVFIESMLYWSSHPPSEDRPAGAPPVDPAFDLVFDPVRDNEVVAGEYPDGADSGRIEEIEAAIFFLASMVADTAAHEFGHSLGLAQPFILDGAYHNAVPQTGCLMDSGADRPLVERARLEGNEGARFCQENLWYLLDILPMDWQGLIR